MTGVEGSTFHGGPRELPNPLAKLADAQRRVGLISLAGAGIGVLSIALAVAVPSLSGVGSVRASVVVSGIGSVVFGIVGMVLLVRQVDLRAPLVIPPDAPGDFRFMNEAQEALKRREMPAFTVAPVLLRKVRRILGGRSGYGTPAEHAIAQDTLDKVSFAAGIGVMSLIIFPLIGLSMGSKAGAILGLVVAIGLCTLLGWWVVQRTRVLKEIFPADGPISESDEEIVTVHGGGDPFVLASEVEQRMMSLRAHGQPNRTAKAGWTRPDSTMTEAGRVEGNLLIETHPVANAVHEHSAAPSFLQRYVDLRTVAPFLVCVTLPWVPGAVQIMLALSGTAMVWMAQSDADNYRRLTQKIAWTSTIAYIEMEGSVGRTEIRAGRAHTDSFESSNTVIRSDCQLRIRTAELTTQSDGVKEPRTIIAMQHTVASQQVMTLVKQSVEEFEAKGVRIRGIDLDADAIRSTVQANVVAEGAKARSRKDAVEGLEAPEAQVKLDGPQTNGAWREAKVRRLVCPECQAVVEVVEDDEPVCQHCGHGAPETATT